MAANNPKYKLLSPEDMTKAIAENKKTNKMYYPLKSSEKSKEISSLVTNQRTLLNESLKLGRVSLKDDNFEMVVERVSMYFDSCIKAGMLPSFTGVAVYGLGYTYRGVVKYISDHPETNVARFLDVIRDSIGDMILQSGSRKITSEILTIFALRNAHGFSNEDKPLVGLDDDFRETTAAEIAEKYANIGDD